ncbi:hypothetical protein FH972_005706 [Carpinus fangiana]|uniref:Uncharacterized protein n=1 Tax=Carpinus fangiana TaxID=176857 RepID=A0A5N6QRZ3_9ROSI|nr:hypothetical protein FH972_005706 [Carpinus fangiana]
MTMKSASVTEFDLSGMKVIMKLKSNVELTQRPNQLLLSVKLQGLHSGPKVLPHEGIKIR